MLQSSRRLTQLVVGLDRQLNKRPTHSNGLLRSYNESYSRRVVLTVHNNGISSQRLLYVFKNSGRSSFRVR